MSCSSKPFGGGSLDGEVLTSQDKRVLYSACVQSKIMFCLELLHLEDIRLCFLLVKCRVRVGVLVNSKRVRRDVISRLLICGTYWTVRFKNPCKYFVVM